jgi:signal transduction histidine kinase
MIASRHLLQPLRMLWQAILHVSPETTSVGPPNLEKLHLGRQLVTSLANRVYQFASQQGPPDKAGGQGAAQQAVDIVNHFPLPMFVFDKDQVVTHASDASLKFLVLENLQLVGQHISDSISFEFPGEHTLQSWIADCQANKATDSAYWQRVQVHLRDGQSIKQCDMAAYYNRDNEFGAEFIVTLFDRTDQYQRDDQDLSFIALAVHELRTPLTTLRGYIEALEEDLEGKLTPELDGYMQRLSLSADQLSAFVANILNVVKIEENQLQLQLTEADWEPTLRNAAATMASRASMLGKSITFRIQPGLPKVAVDQVSIGEVVNNLLDNAIKYSNTSNEIVVSANLTNDGIVETTIQDFGVGIPESVLPNLFEKFYRNHRTKASIGGTGLGLYLTKAIVDAHGGHIWVKSKVGEGSTFGFTLQPYAHLAEDLKTSNNNDITRHAHGWIKNHSLYRK